MTAATDQLTIPDPVVDEPTAPATKKRSAAELTADLRLRLRSRYAEARRYAVLEEVGNGTGSAASRSCDLLAISLWPMDHLEWHGHEVKASRSDWLREIKDPDKADAFARYCDRWWIVAADRAVVHLDELRDGWGLLVPSGDGLRAVVGAAKRKPQEAPRSLFAALIRRVMEASPGEDERRALFHQAAEAERKLRDAERVRGLLQQRLDEQQKAIADFEAASGLRIENYGGKRLGEDVARLHTLDLGDYRIGEFERLAGTARRLAEAATDALEAAKALGTRAGR